MIRIFGLIALAALCAMLGTSLPSFAQAFPEATLQSGSLSVKLYLPDTANGYYRGSRFDWSGVIPSLQWNGHSYFGQWFSQYDPKLHDAIMGPVEEFGVLGYETAKVGENFLKIGVGALRKSDDKPYSFAGRYVLADAGERTITKKKDRIIFVHILKDAAGYSYRYTKTVRVDKRSPRLYLEHKLENTGRKSIATTVYNHNFFVIDSVKTGPDVRIGLPFDVTAEGRNFGVLADASGHSITFRAPLPTGETVFSAGLNGFDKDAPNHGFSIENVHTRAGVRALTNKPLEKFVFWACGTTACPEPYMRLFVKAGKRVKWTTTYEFYNF